MELEDAELFVQAAQKDYVAMVRVYSALVIEALALGLDETREARSDVLAAQQVREVAQRDLDLAQRKDARREEEGCCTRCGEHVGADNLYSASGYALCATCDAQEQEDAR